MNTPLHPHAAAADVIIIGGGCAGLTLAAHLAGQGEAAPRTLVLEPRETYRDDRTFSGWRTTPHLFSNCVTARWRQWRVAAGAQAATRSAGALVYETIPAGRFYAAALASIAANPRVRVLRGQAAHGTGSAGGQAFVTTPTGTLWARLVVDTRPPPPAATTGLVQSFTGIEVETAAPCFDPETVGLMEFAAPEATGITFLYTLPFSPTRALFELTHMTPALRDPPGQDEVAALLRARLGCGFQVIRTERGVLPMRNMKRAALPPRIVRLGTAAGALRAATGYGFAAIQAQAASLAAAIARDVDAAALWQPPRPPLWLRLMDEIFLRVLRAHPRLGPELFFRLFARCEPATLVRFLTATGGLAGAARVATALPVGLFVRAAAGLAAASLAHAASRFMPQMARPHLVPPAATGAPAFGPATAVADGLLRQAA